MSFKSGDLETYSKVNLKTAGLDVYSRDPSTGIHCFSFGSTQDDIKTWIEGQPFPEEMREHLAAGGIFTAWNAAFEISLWLNCAVRKYGWPVLPVEQVQCSMAQAYAMALPGALENAGPALGVSQRKDAVGKRVMLMLAQPKADGTMWRPEHDPAKFRQLYEYNRQDVRTELSIRERLMELSENEQRIWHLDWAVNNRGILVDLLAIGKGLALVAQEKLRLDREILAVTSGVVGSCTEVQLLVKWIKSQGVKITGLAKADVLDALGGDDLPPQVRIALELRKEAAKSSTAKLVAMRDRAAGDGRIRGIHQYHGASTGRWAGRGVQTQNLPRCRPGIKPQDVEDIIAHLGSREYVDTFYGPTLDALSDSLRGMIIAPPGKDLVAVDLKSIEAVVLAWLAGEQSVLGTYARGEDLYIAAAAKIYHAPAASIDKKDPRRQIGKVSVLACGFGGGVGAFQSMAKVYNVKVPDAEAEQIKVAWRKAHPLIVAYWGELEAALYTLTSGRPMTVGLGYGPGRSVTFKKAGSFLWCQLPSKRVLCYPYPEIREVTTPWGEDKDALTYMTVVSNVKAKILPDPASSGTWKRISTYGGSICENVVQAVARDILADALLRFEQHGAKIVMHCHDEIVVEVDHDAPEDTVKKFETLMTVTPSWAIGLPLAAEGWRGRRYRK